jgi:hypothetical protein
MQPIYSNFISSVSSKAQSQLKDYGELAQLNVLWAGSPDFDARITQEEIDTVPSFAAAGLTVQQLSDAVYVLEQIRTLITNALPALSVIARL